ncbi:serine hydrolase [Niastella sp. OAS944]|uniref:serine hydrolase n=1 Tax=Niastella sp. OAS944 TaxID=2664089 RepID=UPI00346F7063|nr:CubicO group peptidase (beta-lactamase class C family) [Chitinophagaceae bacterium OAS944]
MLEEIEIFIEKTVKAFQLPGLAVGIMENGEVKYQKGFGFQSIDSKIPVSANTVFQQGSLAKAFVATAIMQLVEQKKISLDEKVVTYLPYFKMKDPRYRDITIGQIVSHTSCIPDVESFDWDSPQTDEAAARRYVESLGDIALLGEPGKIYHYSNRAYNILADVIHVTSGTIFETYMKENLFMPMNMADSTFIYGEIKKELLAWPHQLDRNFKNAKRDVYPYNRIHAPSSTLYASMTDLMNWITMNLNGGTFNGNQIVSSETHSLMMQPAVTTETDTYMCLAWKKAIRHGHTLLVSSGGEPGFRSFLIMAPEKNLAVIASCNSDTLSAEHIGLPVILKLLGQELPEPKMPIYFPMGRTILEKGIHHAIDEYHYLKNNCPEQYDFHESHLHDLAFKLLNKKRKADEAAHIFELSIASNASYWWTFSGLAQAYERLGKKESAVQNYVRALDMNPGNQFIIQRLEKIGYLNK